MLLPSNIVRVGTWNRCALPRGGGRRGWEGIEGEEIKGLVVAKGGIGFFLVVGM